MALPVENYVPQVARPARREVATARAFAVWAGCGALTTAWVCLFFAAPLLEARGQGTASWMLYRLFAPLCHQLPERSFYVAGYPLAVCARCAGIYVGYTVTLLLYPLVRSLRRTDAPARVWLFAAAAPTAIDFLVNFTGLWHNTHSSRALTGAILGAAAVFYTLPGLVDVARDFKGKRAPRAEAELATT